MPSNPTVLDNIAKLKEINPTSLPVGATLLVRNPGSGLPPGAYTLLDSTLAEFLPIIVTPNAGGTRRWLSHNNVIVRAIDPTITPPFINLEWINTTNGNIYTSINTTSSAGWFQVQGMGAGSSTNV